MFDPPKVRKGQKLKLLWGFFRPQFAYFCLFWHLERPRPASQWVRPNFFGPEGGQTIPPHHSIAKYLKNLKLIPRTTTFFLRHCVKVQSNITCISDGEFLDILQPKDGCDPTYGEELHKTVKKFEAEQSFIYIGADSTAVNTGLTL